LALTATTGLRRGLLLLGHRVLLLLLGAPPLLHPRLLARHHAGLLSQRLA
jgi:hypothetical protein